MRALSVFSGGLDSMLSAQVLREQDIDVLALFFETPFFSSTTARKSAATINLPIEIIDITKDHMGIVKKPKHGYGGNMNPCIDCHAMMLRKAGEMLEEKDARFLITGEVLGQRPMSQNRQSLATVASESGFEGLILRPLSAKRLPITIPEEKGWVNRDLLKGFSGRSRKPQMALALAFNVKEYPSPAGGCLLTDKEFSRRLQDLFTHETKREIRDIELLRVGRHFRLNPQTKLIVGRNRSENQAIRDLFREGDALLWSDGIPGPTVLLVGERSPALESQAAVFTASYSDTADHETCEIIISDGGNERGLEAESREKDAFKEYMV
ncbi:MAG: tRNA 4-thiouridine(8) synthase ThiI [Deltaproteobacteria bacterium]|nr:tRNA 4-thiouridine(8) synthase ThiI [Deltaproteobacteria bacterium]